MSNYTSNIEKYTKEYHALRTEYEQIVSSEEYEGALVSSPFEFLTAVHTCEAMEMFNNAPEEAPLKMPSLKNALALYKNVVDFRVHYEDVLNKASLIVDAEALVDKINSLVESTPYLSSGLAFQKGRGYSPIATECIKKLSQIPSLYTKRFKTRFVESCMDSLSIEDIDVLIKEGVIKELDVDMVKMTGGKNYKAAFSHMLDVFGKEDVKIRTFKLSLAGVTYRNDDGKNRQDILATLAKQKEKGYSIDLKAEPFMYKPEVGDPEPAISVTHNGVILGYVPADVVKEIDANFGPTGYEVELLGFTGGKDGLSFGCDINLSVFTRPDKEIESNEIEK